ncbi:hypothetical protein, partial [Prevotella dentalis]|uniref:hypothetical protein n=1 Tax=Prevotella dentalis TaxID=52227 RepID=UPI002657DAC0
MIRFLDAQLLLSIVASSLYLLFENLIEGSTIFGVFLLLLRLVIPEVVLFPDFVIVSPKSLRQRVLLFSDVL